MMCQKAEQDEYTLIGARMVSAHEAFMRRLFDRGFPPTDSNGNRNMPVVGLTVVGLSREIGHLWTPL